MPRRSITRRANRSRSFSPGDARAATKSSIRAFNKGDGTNTVTPVPACRTCTPAGSRSVIRRCFVNVVPNCSRLMMESASPSSTRARISASRRDTHAGQTASISAAVFPRISAGRRSCRRASNTGFASEYDRAARLAESDSWPADVAAANRSPHAMLIASAQSFESFGRSDRSQNDPYASNAPNVPIKTPHGTRTASSGSHPESP